LTGTEVPPGYEELVVDGARVIARHEQRDAVRAALENGTLYEYARGHAAARSLTGRGVAYAVPLPDGSPVVVRHNRHGGLLAPLTGDRFLPPTRAPYELAVSRRLTTAGVPTPEIIAYAIYPAGPLLRRSDVVSREIANSADLAVRLTTGQEVERRAALEASAVLIARLSRCGARHHDLNVKNILLAGGTAWVLDVDRVEFGTPGDEEITARNLERFARSARKWRERHGARVDDAELSELAASVRRLVSDGIVTADRARTRS
jgi:3-deoxy-D-manno-octulosonic acid kinase